MKLLGIKKTRTAPYRPQSDGVVERTNRTLKGLLSAYVQHDYDTWDEFLPYVLLSYRSSVHESTGCTPNLLFFGRECNLPVDYFFGLPPDAEELDCPHIYVEWMRDAGRRTHKFVREHLTGALITQKRSYDKQAVIRTFEQGDMVYRYYLPQSAKHKFAAPWRGPYQVLARMSDVNYRIQMREDAAIVVHVDHLRRCFPRGDVFIGDDDSDSDSSESDFVSADEEELEPLNDVAPNEQLEPLNDIAPNEQLEPLNDIVSDEGVETVDFPIPVLPSPMAPPALARTRRGRVVRPPERLITQL